MYQLNERLINTLAVDVAGGNRIHRINIKAQHSPFREAISKTVSKSIHIY